MKEINSFSVIKKGAKLKINEKLVKNEEFLSHCDIFVFSKNIKRTQMRLQCWWLRFNKGRWLSRSGSSRFGPVQVRFMLCVSLNYDFFTHDWRFMPWKIFSKKKTSSFNLIFCPSLQNSWKGLSLSLSSPPPFYCRHLYETFSLSLIKKKVSNFHPFAKPFKCNTFCKGQKCFTV